METADLHQITTRTTRTLAFEDTPAASYLLIPLSHIGSQVKRRQSQSYKFKEFAKISNFEKKHYTWHTFWSRLIRCANMKWIRWVLLKIQSEHDSVHRRTDGRTDRGETSIPPFQLRWSGGYNDSKYLNSSLTEIEPHAAITNQPEESKEKR